MRRSSVTGGLSIAIFDYRRAIKTVMKHSQYGDLLEYDTMGLVGQLSRFRSLDILQ